MSSPYFRQTSTRNAASKALAALTSASKKKSTKAPQCEAVAASENPPSGAKVDGWPIKIKQEVEEEDDVKPTVDNDDFIKYSMNNSIFDDNISQSTNVVVKSEEVSPAKRKIKSPKKLISPKKEKVDYNGWEPPNWREVLKKIRIMRQNEDAPVDTQGCERTADEDEGPEVCNGQHCAWHSANDTFY